MRGKIRISVLLVVIVLGLSCPPARGEEGFFRSRLTSAAPSGLMLRSGGGASSRGWWGVLYKDALLLARMDGDETEDSAENATEEAPEPVEFVWPVLSWLLSLLGL